MSGSSQRVESPVFTEYMELLHTQWTRPVACQDRCEPAEACTCQRHIVHVDAVIAWWLRTTSDNPEQTNLYKLLDEMPTARHRTFPLFKRVFAGEHSCLRVFSLLLKQGRGHLADRFHDCDMNDKYLDITRVDSNQRLRDSLAKIVDNDDDARTIVEEFHKEKWQYCPLKLTLDMTRHLNETKVIPPFCHKIKLGDKGGTASIYWVAIQKDFVTDKALINAIRDSLYEDPEHGQCYQMVLKTYCGNKKSVYESEKEAFSALNPNDRIPIIRYLGCYTHDYGEGPRSGETYNLLLECGKCDLFQSWADDTNVPPVRAEEIVQVWRSLFGVAEAIRHIHNLQYPRHGKNATLRKYVGWHADIKPDNILLVGDRLKLADFGYSRFTSVTPDQHVGVQTEFIDGFTDTYGAPEVSRMKQPDGTRTGVTQSIDTWSFGCVLSVAATWVVLGFQGIRQFHQLRLQAKPNRAQGKLLDRFHDGFQVLPEIRQWHNYLRGHLRPSDTTTEFVLDLIENNMLQREPANRVDLEVLCKKLQNIIKWASTNINDLSSYSRSTDPVVMRALLNIEEQAHNDTSNRRKTTTFHPNPASGTYGVALNPFERVTMHVDKKDYYRTKPIGRTPYRREILEDQLKETNIVVDVGGSKDAVKHNGGFTESPTDHDPSVNLFGRQAKPKNPNLLSPIDYNAPSKKSRQPEALFGDHPESHSGLRTANGHHIEPLGIAHPSSRVPMSIEANSEAQRRKENDDLKQEQSSWHSPRQSPPLAVHNAQPIATPLPSPEAYSNSPNSSHRKFSPQDLTTIDSPRIAEPGSASPTPSHEKARWPPDRIPQLETPNPSKPCFNDDRIYDTGHLSAQKFENSPLANPQIFVSQPHPLTRPESQIQVQSQEPCTAEKQVIYTDTTNFDPAHESEPIPSSVLMLPYDVCRVRKDIDEDSPRGKLATFKGMLKVEERKAEKGLVKTYEKREIVFVVDNGATMFEHWPIVVFVAETLVKKAAGLDKNGVDLRFTIDGATHNRSGLKRDQGRRVFKEALEGAAPDNVENDKTKTDMHRILSDMVDDWKSSGRRATTLIVLTDGIWKQTLPNLVDQTILDVAKEAAYNQNVGRRPFSIQFVRFGDAGRERLDRLDNELCNSRGFRDIVDHCSWRSTVEKIFKGSIEGQHDQNEPADPGIKYHYPELVQLFQKFNDGLHQDNDQDDSNSLAPSRLSVVRSPSRSSSSSDSRKNRGSAPVAHRESWHPGHSRYPFST